METTGCWCGNRALVPFSPAYFRCPVCETLVTSQFPDPDFVKVTDDDQDFYGRNYWFSHQETALGNPDLTQRARADLPERDLYWLRTLLKYRRPPARSLELGCAHGGLVALMQWAGFQATGLELSVWIVNFARQTFGVPVLHGPLEEQAIAPASLDIIALMDVLEHLADPVATMRLSLDLLAPAGFLLIQTPCYREGKSYEAMVAENDPFLRLLKAEEHLYLFSRSAVGRLFKELGAPYIQFEPAIFSHYDMFMLVSRDPLRPLAPSEGAEKPLSEPPGARLVQALLDGQARLQESEADRQARLEVIQTLDRAYQATETDRQARLQAITRLEAALSTSESDRQRQHERVSELEKSQAEQARQTQAQLKAKEAEAAWWKEQAEQLSGMRGVRVERWLHKIRPKGKRRAD